MPPLPRKAFEHALRGLNRDEFSALIADLYAVRGWTTDVRDGVILAERDATNESEVRRIQPLPFRRFGRFAKEIDDADVIVAAQDSLRARQAAAAVGATYVPPAELRNHLLYAIERTDGERLLFDYLGLSTTVPEPDADPASRISTTLASSGGAIGRVSALVTLLVIVVAAIAGPSLLGMDFWPGADQESFTPAPSPTPEPTPMGGYPPGVDANGLADVKALAAAHQTSVAEQSYTYWYHVDAPSTVELPIVGGGNRSATHHIAANGTIVSEGFFDWNRSDKSVGRFWAYDDGQRSYSRSAYYRTWTAETPREIRYHQGSTRRLESFEQEFQTLLTYYLLTNESHVTVINEDPSIFRIVATGKPVVLPSAMSNYTARATVTSSGRVTRVGVTFDIRGINESGTLEFGIRRVGETTVSPPDWLDEAKEEMVNMTSVSTETATAAGPA